MFEYMGWDEVADGFIYAGIEKTIEQKAVTYDFERLMEGATKLKCSEFAARRSSTICSQAGALIN